VLQRVVGEGQGDFGRRFVADQAARNLLLRRDGDHRVAFNDGLAGQGVAGGQVGSAQADGGAAAQARAILGDHGTAATAPLPATGHVQV